VSQAWIYPQIGYATFWNDNYKIEYETFNFGYIGSTNPTNERGSIANIALPVITNGELVTYGEWCGANCPYPKVTVHPTMITINKDIKGIDFKLDLGFSTSQAGYYSIYLNNIVVYIWSWNPSIAKDMFTFETKSHLLDKNLVDVYAKGRYINTFNITDEKISVKIEPLLDNYDNIYRTGLTTYIDNLRFRVKFNCEIDSDEMLVTEIYNSGETIQMDNNQSISADGCEVESWCRRHPAFIITDIGSTSDEGDEIYESMTSGYSLTVPAGETWQLFFITKKDSVGRCEGYTAPQFEPVSITTVTSPQTIYPGATKTFETEHIDITSMPQVLKATFLIKAVGGGLEQTKDEVIVFRR